MKNRNLRLDYKSPKIQGMLCEALEELNSWNIKKDRRGLSTQESKNLSLILNGRYSSEYLRSLLKSMPVRKTIVRYMEQVRSNSSTSISTPEDSSAGSDAPDLDSTSQTIGIKNTFTDAEYRHLKTENEELKRKYHEIQMGLHDALTKNKHLEFENAAFKKREIESHQRLRVFVEAELQAVNRTKFENCKSGDIKRYSPNSSR